MTSARIPEEDACHRAHNLCVFSRVQKGTPRLTHKWCVLQRVSFGALSDVTIVLWMRQSIVVFGPWCPRCISSSQTCLWVASFISMLSDGRFSSHHALHYYSPMLLQRRRPFFSSKNSQFPKHISQSQLNTRHVCTYLNAFFMVNPNVLIKINNFDIFEGRIVFTNFELSSVHACRMENVL